MSDEKNVEKNLENRLLKVIEDAFARQKIDAKLHNLKQRYRKKIKKQVTKQNEIFAQGYSGSGPSEKDPIKIGGQLEKIIKEYGWEQKLLDGKILSNWEKIVGPDVAKNTRIKKLENNTLYIQAKSTAWVTQLNLLQSHILRKINLEIPENNIKKIVILSPLKPSWNKGKYHVKGRGPRDTYG